VGHDHHFLERLDRVERDQLEYALGLYRDHESVRYVLSHLERDDDRVAFAIGTVERGPYVVVARNGAFVTCLGEGMTPGRLHVVPRKQLDALRTRYRDQRTREQIAEDLRREGENDRMFFTRIFDRANTLCREEFMAVAAFAPLFATRFYTASTLTLGEMLTDMTPLAKVTRFKPGDLPHAKNIHRSYWFTAHAILLATMGEKGVLDTELLRIEKAGVTLTMGTSLYGSMTHLLRSAWAAAQIAETAIPPYAKHLVAVHSIEFVVDDIAALGAIALRHESLRPKILEILERALEQFTAGGVETGVFKTLTEIMIKTIDDPEPAITETTSIGQVIYMEMTAHLPEGDPHRFPSWDKVPPHLGITALLSADIGIINETKMTVLSLMSVPVAVRARAEDFYFERELARKLLPEWTPEATLAIIQRLAVAGYLSSIPVVNEPKPGRNDPCHCGSGKKFKKCHGR